MKILELAPYALIPGNKNFEKNNSGLAVAITDICVSLSKMGHEVSLLTQSSFTNGFKWNYINVVKKRWLDLLKNMKYIYLKNGIKACRGLNTSFLYKLKVLIYFSFQGYVEKIIDYIQPDIVHIHTIGYYSMPYMMACSRLGIPFVVTLHGMVTFVDETAIDDKQRKLEKKFCQLADEKKIPVTVISSGIKKRMTNEFKIAGDGFKIVLNGVPSKNAIKKSEIENVKKKYHISDEKVFVCVGSLGERKNQVQAVRAFALLNDELKKKVKLLILGDGPCRNMIEKEITNLGLTDTIICCGYIPHNALASYYSLAYCNIVVSKDEGFGLPIIEAFQYGVPTIVFEDLDAVKDLFDDEAMILVPERTDMALKDALCFAFNNPKDSKKILMHASQFTMEHMAKDYSKIFRGLYFDKPKVTEKDLQYLL